MASAGISYNDTVTQKKYLRYCEDYNTAWIEFMPQIADTVRKFDGKKITKRIDTAVKKIDNRFSFRIYSGFTTGTGYVYLDWYDYDSRQFRDDATGQWEYVNGSNNFYIIMHHVDDMECFDAEQFVSALENRAEYFTSNRDNVYAALDNMEELKDEYNAALKAFNDVCNKIPSAIKKYYKIDNTYINNWQ